MTSEGPGRRAYDIVESDAVAEREARKDRAHGLGTGTRPNVETTEPLGPRGLSLPRHSLLLLYGNGQPGDVSLGVHDMQAFHERTLPRSVFVKLSNTSPGKA